MRIAISFFFFWNTVIKLHYVQQALKSSSHSSLSYGFEAISRPIFTLFDLSYKKKRRYCTMKKRFCIYGYKVVASPCSYVVWRLSRIEALKGTMACWFRVCLGFVVWLLHMKCATCVCYAYWVKCCDAVVKCIHVSVHGCKMVGCGRLGLWLIYFTNL